MPFAAGPFRLDLTALPTETKFECGTSQSKTGTSVNVTHICPDAIAGTRWRGFPSLPARAAPQGIGAVSLISEETAPIPHAESYLLSSLLLSSLELSATKVNEP
jgi:hypothetical protein